jgi:hypothetical protein
VDRLRLGETLTLSSPVTSHQAIEVVAVRSISAEGLLIKQAFDAAAQANLIRAILEAHRPTHPAMPTAAQEHHSSGSQPGGNYSKRPQPTRLLFLFTHPPQPVHTSQRQAYAEIPRVRNTLCKVMNPDSFHLPKSMAGVLTFVRWKHQTILRLPPNRCTLPSSQKTGWLEQFPPFL